MSQSEQIKQEIQALQQEMKVLQQKLYELQDEYHKVRHEEVLLVDKERRLKDTAERSRKREFRVNDVVRVVGADDKEFVGRIVKAKHHFDRPELDWCTVCPEDDHVEIAVSNNEIREIISSTCSLN
jgi:chromosome segregation ATPase